MRRLTRRPQETGESVRELVTSHRVQVDAEIMTCLGGLSPPHWQVLNNPQAYLGFSVRKTGAICDLWEKYLNEKGNAKNE